MTIKFQNHLEKLGLKSSDLVVSDNFYLFEFVPKKIIDIYGLEAINFIPNKIITIAQLIRTLSDGPIFINNYHIGGRLHYRGMRYPMYKLGAKDSRHKLNVFNEKNKYFQFDAIDFHSNELTIFQLYDLILKNESTFLKLGLRRIEKPNFTKGFQSLL